MTHVRPRPSSHRRRATVASIPALFALVAAAGRTGTARARTGPVVDMVAFDDHYIPALFLTGQAAAGPTAVPRAQAAMARMTALWPELRTRLAAVGRSSGEPDVWRRALGKVDAHLAHAQRDANAGRWSQAHESLEHVRFALLDARRATGIDYALDRMIDYHESMEVLAGAGARARGEPLGVAGRQALTREYAAARARWESLERLPPDPVEHRLSPPRLAQYQRGMADERAALSALSDALRDADDTTLLEAAAAVKPPFARAYSAFGLPLDEAASK